MKEGNVYLISPTEPDRLRLIGETSLIPENYGADVLFSEREKLIGVQRKSFPSDFLASLYDGRLAKEIGQMKALDYAVLLLEGRAAWTLDGELSAEYGTGISKAAFRNICHSIWWIYNISIEWADSIDDTITAISALRHWVAQETHDSLLRRPKSKDYWGTHTRGREWGIHFLQGFPGIGPTTAASIYDTFDRVPLRWDISQDELIKVHGIGQTKSAKLWSILSDDNEQTSTEFRGMEQKEVIQ